MPEPHRQPHAPLASAGQIHHHVSDMAVTFAADVTLAQLQSQLAAHNQWLPMDGAFHVDGVLAESGHPGFELPLGELMLRNSTGPLRLGYGAWRDVLLGAQFTNGRGELITVGGRVLKNVAGYDVTKFLVGSHGIFGKPVTLTARTWRRPAGAIHVDVDPRRISLGTLIATPLRPQWALRISHELITLGYLGDEPALQYCDRSTAALEPLALRKLTVDEDAAARHRLWPITRAQARAFVPPARIDDFIATAGLAAFAADPAFGIVLPTGGIEVDSAKFAAAARGVGGSAAFYDAAGRLQRATIEPSAYVMLQKLKTAFDPDATLPPLPKNIA